MSLRISLFIIVSCMTLSIWLPSALGSREPCPPGTSPETAGKVGQRIGSFHIPEPTSIETILKNIIAVLPEIDFDIPDDAKESVAVRVANATPWEILDLLVLPAGYIWECSGESILVTRDPVTARRRELMLALARMDADPTPHREDYLDQKVGEPLRIQQPVEINRLLDVLSVLFGGPSDGLNYVMLDGHETEVEIVTEGKTIREILGEIVAGRRLAWEEWDGWILITGDFRSRLFPLTPSEYEKVLVVLDGLPPSAPERLREIHFVVDGTTYSRKDDPAVVRKVVLDTLADTSGQQ